MTPTWIAEPLNLEIAAQAVTECGALSGSKRRRLPQNFFRAVQQEALWVQLPSLLSVLLGLSQIAALGFRDGQPTGILRFAMRSFSLLHGIAEEPNAFIQSSERRQHGAARALHRWHPREDCHRFL